MGNGMNKVLPGLYVGNYQDSKDADQLERFEITHILAIHDTARRLHSDKHYLCILAADSPDQNLSQYFSLCNDFIHAARLRGGNVLIHCLAGMSRSVTVAVAYIMSTTSLSWKEALKVVRVGRSIANPNVGFQQQLKDFESSRLQDERNRLKERFPSLALTESDAEVCRSTLRNYETLALAKEVCEGKCAMGRTCPTGLCRQATKRTLRRKSSTSSIGSVSSGRTPPQTPRMLPSAPPSPALHRSSSVMSTSRPRSGPAGLHSYTGGSAPPSRAVSRVDLSAAVACSSSNTNLSAIGRSSAFSSSNWRLTAGFRAEHAETDAAGLATTLAKTTLESADAAIAGTTGIASFDDDVASGVARFSVEPGGITEGDRRTVRGFYRQYYVLFIVGRLNYVIAVIL